jgi:hypothetical protein
VVLSAKHYGHSLQIGGPVLQSDAQIAESPAKIGGGSYSG